MSNLVDLAGRQYGNVSGGQVLDAVMGNANLLEHIKAQSDETINIQETMLKLINNLSQNNACKLTEYKKTYELSKNETNETLKLLLKKLDSNVEELAEDFDDIHLRICNFGIAMRLLDDIMNVLDETNQDEKYLLRISMIIHDLIKKIKAEKVNQEQFGIIKKGMLTIISGKASKSDFIQLDNALLDHELDWIFGDANV